MKRWPFGIAAAFLMVMNLIHQTSRNVDWHDPTSAILLCGYVTCAALCMASGSNNHKGPSE